MTSNTENYKDIPGWGMDADPKNEPTYPMKEYTGDDHKRSNYERAPQQKQSVELLQSLERPEPSRVFGATVPPSGLSGAIRRYAFKHSEDKVRHWIPLLMADRIQVWEGLVEDLTKGYIPNIVAERGLATEWKHNPKGMLKKAAVCATIALVIGCALRRNKG
ncbi:hypothetical protein M8998_02655 [Sphingobacterium sp. lm-10]|uniref:hypothetical protein n=1 Tax=Sphingobacterium sp. lm-10 TaxID=2944904 RepID=UPI002021A81E|nr:hypothetical protein [Sphingobacterium sp. lm-10]MCL7986835.1 hypothetical protein [Sphingobacterium sp. lm-10]